MMLDERSPIADRFEHLLAVISSKKFLNMEGIVGEVPFFICPFRVDETIEMEKLRSQLIKTLDKKGVKVLEINLYDLALELLKRRGIFERILQTEPTISKQELKELLQGVLDPERHMVPAIAEKMAETDFDVLFISGVGEVFPYIRSHSILNNLQSKAKDRPTVMFFPGSYTSNSHKGASLNLFGRLKSDKYYRAFNIFHCQP